MPGGHDIIVIGASAGGVAAFQRLLPALPADLPAALFVVLHLSPYGPSALPRILSRVGRLPAAHPADGDPIVPGRIYVAPPDRHMLVGDNRIQLSVGPRENHSRPAIDPLFRSAALAYGPRVVGVVLSGLLYDGCAGLIAIRARGGVTVVQDPDEAEYAGMPRSAIAGDSPDHVLPLELVAPLLIGLAATPTPPAESYPVPQWLKLESGITAMDESLSREAAVRALGAASPFVSAAAHDAKAEVQQRQAERILAVLERAHAAVIDVERATDIENL